MKIKTPITRFGLTFIILIFQANEEMVNEALESKEPAEETDTNMEEQTPEGIINYIFQSIVVKL